MQLDQLALPGAYLVRVDRKTDPRGWLWKPYTDIDFERFGLRFECKEAFYSRSSRGVLRGMHYQAPPYASTKLVTCLAGEVLDVLLDLRLNSVTFGVAIGLVLSCRRPDSVFVPKGVAHGFVVKRGPALLAYHTDAPYENSADMGIKWDTIPFAWPVSDTKSLIVSARDKSLPDWERFTSPFA